MRLYCSCGYPIIVTARWDGDDAIDIRLRDGKEVDTGQSIVTCPLCGQRMSLGGLRPRPPHTEHWFVWQDIEETQETADSLDTGDQRSEDAG